MVHIEKGVEPRSLAEYRESTPNASYGGLPTDVKDDVRASLLIEQGSICAYCMERTKHATTTIEHSLPQSVDGARDLDYSNMLGVCPGNEGYPYSKQTCGCRRKNLPLTINPHEKTYIDTISYAPNGQITSNVDVVNDDINNALNLNVSFLIRNRKAALDILKKELHRRRASGSWKPLAEKYMAKLSEADMKRPYCGVLLWYLRSKV